MNLSNAISIAQVGPVADPVARAEALASAVSSHLESGRTVKEIWHSRKEDGEMRTVTVNNESYLSRPKGGVRSGYVYILPVISHP